jgi:hypothetical protein
MDKEHLGVYLQNEASFEEEIMKDASYEIRVGYLNALDNLMIDNEGIISHDEIKPFDDDSMSYIVISGQTFVDSSLKCGFSTDHVISLNIVTKFVLGSGTKKKSEDIAEKVLQRVLLRPGKTAIITPSFNIWHTQVNSRTLVDDTDERIITKVLTFQHKINEI